MMPIQCKIQNSLYPKYARSTISISQYPNGSLWPSLFPRLFGRPCSIPSLFILSQQFYPQLSIILFSLTHFFVTPPLPPHPSPHPHPHLHLHPHLRPHPSLPLSPLLLPSPLSPSPST